MAFWNKNNDEYERTDHVIQAKPGIKPAGIADTLKVPRSSITRRLPAMEEAGYLYSEDDKGGIWPFKHRK